MAEAKKEVRISKVLAQIYNNIFRSKLGLRNQMLAGALKTIALTFDTSCDSAYTFPMGKDAKNYRIMIGGKMIAKIAKCPAIIKSKEDIRENFEDIVSAFYGLDYHEMGHILFTDMSDTSIADYPEEKYRGFLHSLFNIVEDPIIENSMTYYFAKKYPWAVSPQEFFDVIINALFTQQCIDYTDDGSISAFMQYLLLTLRCGSASIATKNAVFEKYKENLLPLIKDIIMEEDGTERIHKTITLGEYIIKNITEFKWEDVPTPERPISGSRKGTDVKPMKAKGGTKDFPTEVEEDPKGKEEISEEGEGKPLTPKTEETIDDADLEEVFIDTFVDGADHQWNILKDSCEPDEDCSDIVENWISEFKDTVNDVSKFLNLFHSRIGPKNTSGFTRGKLNLKAAMQDELIDGCDLKLFNQKVKRGKAPDVCISLLCDNSGSMHGDKSIICAKAAAVLGQACEWAKVPFECNAFTKTSDSSSGTSITLKIKDFDDQFESSKPFWVANDYRYWSKLRPTMKIPFFSGNSEEINIYHINESLKKVKHETKILLVLCDGCTTGSKNDLKKLIQTMEQDGIVVIGIGICDREVANVYGQNKIFNNTEDLQNGLADYLVETLSRYAK